MTNPTKTRYEDWIGTTVYDAENDKLGDITDLYYDDITGQPEWMTVSTGWFGTSEQFIPISGTQQHDDGFRIQFTEDQVKDAPAVDADQDHLDATEERRLYDHYGFDYNARNHGDAYRGLERPDEGYDYTDQRPAHDRSAHGETNAVTRSEEELAIDKTEREAGRIRLHKYVVTDAETIHDTVRKEKVDIEGDLEPSSRR